MTDLLDFRTLRRSQVAARADEFVAVTAEVYGAAPFGWTDERAARFADRFAVHLRQPGFVLAEARSGDYVVGYAFGLPLRPSTDWWRQLTTALSPATTTEHPGRTFALADLAVRAPWRRQRIGSTLHDLVLAHRPEERATAAVLTFATAAQSAALSWGWRKIARRQEPDEPVFDLLIRDLPATRP